MDESTRPNELAMLPAVKSIEVLRSVLVDKGNATWKELAPDITWDLVSLSKTEEEIPRAIECLDTEIIVEINNFVATKRECDYSWKPFLIGPGVPDEELPFVAHRLQIIDEAIEAELARRSVS
jgi:hypothetical protein